MSAEVLQSLECEEKEFCKVCYTIIQDWIKFFARYLHFSVDSRKSIVSYFITKVGLGLLKRILDDSPRQIELLLGDEESSSSLQTQKNSHDDGEEVEVEK